MSFTYVGKQNFVTTTGRGRQPPEEGIGWLWQDYHQNRQLYVRSLGKGNYQLAIFVNGVRTTDEITTKGKIQTYTENNFMFQIHDNVFKEMDQSIK
jgi:hypothetical protein